MEELTLPSTSQETPAQRDVRELERFGYAQELLWSMGGFSTFAISFSIIFTGRHEIRKPAWAGEEYPVPPIS